MQIARAQDAVPPGPPPGYDANGPRAMIGRMIGPGVIVDTREIRNSERRLKASQLFSETQNDGQRPLIVTQSWVTEQPVAEHPLCDGCVDPVASEFLDRATKALAVEFGNGMTFRVTMPHPGQFFEKTCNGPTVCEEMLSHYGGGAMFVEHPAANITAKFIRLGCPCAAAGECTCASHNSCGAECAAAEGAACKCCPCAAEAAVAHEAKCGDEGCEIEDRDILIRHVRHFDQQPEHDPITLMHHIASLVGEKAAAQAALAVRKEADEQIGELFETMAELLADNAALDAKLEAAAEQRKLVEKMAELAVENARLKTHIELAAERAEVARNAAALTLENERLKLHIASIEQKHALAEAARTAARPRNERKQR
jgi:hypothetical protein